MKPINEKTISQILEYIKQEQKETGRSPSYRNIQKKIKASSLSVVSRYIGVLKERGLIESGEKGSIAIDSRLKYSEPIPVPLVGCVPCGGPVLAIENIEGTFALPSEIFGKGQLFMLRAQGRSMIGVGIKDGDILVIRKQNYAEYGDIVVAIIDGEATLKTYRPQKDHIVLHPENPEFEDLILEDCHIVGVLASAIHKFK